VISEFNQNHSTVSIAATVIVASSETLPPGVDLALDLPHLQGAFHSHAVIRLVFVSLLRSRLVSGARKHPKPKSVIEKDIVLGQKPIYKAGSLTIIYLFLLSSVQNRKFLLWVKCANKHKETFISHASVFS